MRFKGGIDIKRKKKNESVTKGQTVQSSPARRPWYNPAFGAGINGTNTRQFAKLKEQIPIIGAAISKLNRLLGSFTVETGDEETDKRLRRFLAEVPAGPSQTGANSFIGQLFIQLLVRGTAVGEIVADCDGIHSLYAARPEDVALENSADGTGCVICARGADGRFAPVQFPELISVIALDPEPGEVYGHSILEGLPFVADILLRIFKATGANWDRVGNVRYCVSYNPGEDTAFAEQRIEQIAAEWSKTVNDGESIKDFVTMGDVQVHAIGADNQILDSEVPVRQLLEQIIAKLGIPPFLLGLSWSETERMSQQQADILTSEIESYRRLLEPTIAKIVRVFLALEGSDTEHSIVWDDITLQDITALAEAELMGAQTKKLLDERND